MMRAFLKTMEPSAEQKVAIASWVRGGASIAAVQERLARDFGLSLTYMETRFLVDDLDLSLQEQEAPSAPDGLSSPAKDLHTEREEEAAEGELVEDDLLEGDGPNAGSVRVEVDRVVRPGAMVSGTTEFSDGVKAKWYVDTMGRLGLEAPSPGYRPSEEDIMHFQAELQEALRRSGF